MKKGFTLTEILITMGIIGVVAALAVPNISAKINRNTIGITLARAVELTETGFASMLNVARENAASVTNVAGGEQLIDPGSVSRLSVLQERFFTRNPQDIRTLLDNHYADDGFLQYASTYLGINFNGGAGIITGNQNNPNDIYTNNLPNDIGINEAATPFRLNKINAFIIYSLNPYGNNVAPANIPDDPDLVIGKIYFDVNGLNGPNQFGEDIFLFGLTDSGHLVPAGLQAYNHNAWNDNIPINHCNNDAIPANNNDRLSCAARVVRDGWRVNYSF